MSSQNTTSPNSNLINIDALLKAYRKHWIWVLASIIFFGTLGVISVVKRQPSSEVVAQVLISDESSKSMSAMSELAGMFGGGSFGANRSIDDEMVIIMAHSVLKETVEDLGSNVSYVVEKNFLKKENVYFNPPVVLQYDKAIADTLGVRLTFELDVDDKGIADITVRGRKNKKIASFKNQPLPAVIEIPYGTFMFSPTPTMIAGKSLKECIRLSSYDGAALGLSKQLTVDFAQKKTDVMSLSLVTTDAEFGKLLLNTMIENYNNLTIRQKQAFNQKSLEFLEERILKLSAEVDMTEKEVEAFLGSKDLVNPGAEASIILGRTTTQEVDLVKSENEYELLMMAIDFLTDEANNTSMLPIMPSISSLTGLIEGYNSLILQRLTIESSAKGDNVALKALNDRIDIVKSNLLTALNKQKETSEFEIKELRKQYARSKSKLETVPGIEREYVNIVRKQTLKEQLYTYLLRQREETELAIAGAHPRGVIIDEAFVRDSELGMSGKIILAIFLFLGLAIPAGIFILLWSISKKVSLGEQAETISGFPTIIELESHDSTDEPVVVSESNSATAAQYRLLRSNFLSTISSNEATKTVSVIGTVNNEKSARVAVNFAASLALTGRKVLLIDTDYQNAPVAGMLKIKPSESLSTLASGNTPEIAQVSTGEKTTLNVITTTRGNYSGPDSIASVGFSQVIENQRAKYDFIVINAPTEVNHVASIESLIGLSDVILVTYSIDKTSKVALSRFKHLGSDDKPRGYLVSLS